MSQNNISDLFQKKPYLQFYFPLEVDSGDCQLESAKNPQEYYISVRGKKLASTISPLIQAKRLLEGAKIHETHIVIILGLGNPHLIQLAHETLRSGQIVIFIDHNKNLFSLLWEDWLKECLQIPGRHIFCGEELLPLLWSYLDSLPIEKISGIKFIKNQPSITVAEEFYLPIEERLRTIFSSRVSDLLTKFEFERIWVKNTLQNTIHFFEPNPPRYKIIDFFGKFKGVPGMLVSAGPSLRHYCNVIKEIRDKIFLLSCDTSLKVLTKFGITPDGVVTLDAQTHSFFHFMGEDFSDIPVFGDMVTSPKILRIANTLGIVHSTTAKFSVDAAGNSMREITAGSETAEDILGRIGEIQSGGSVATTAFDLLKNLGCTPIYLIGQDLAYTGREIHSTGTHHNEKWLTLVNRKQSLEKINEAVIRKRKTRFIPSCNGGKVLTDHVLEIYKNWFEESAANISFPIYNINTDGALLDNIYNINADDALEQLMEYPDHNYPWHNLEPWQKKENLVDPQKEKIILDRFREEITKFYEYLDSLPNHADSEELLQSILARTSEVKYLRQMIRKTEVYIQRHNKVLPIERKIDLLVSSLKKELKLLKRSLI